MFIWSCSKTPDRCGYAWPPFLDRSNYEHRAVDHTANQLSQSSHQFWRKKCLNWSCRREMCKCFYREVTIVMNQAAWCCQTMLKSNSKCQISNWPNSGKYNHLIITKQWTNGLNVIKKTSFSWNEETHTGHVSVMETKILEWHEILLQTKNTASPLHFITGN